MRDIQLNMHRVVGGVVKIDRAEAESSLLVFKYARRQDDLTFIRLSNYLATWEIWLSSR